MEVAVMFDVWFDLKGRRERILMLVVVVVVFVGAVGVRIPNQMLLVL